VSSPAHKAREIIDHTTTAVPAAVTEPVDVAQRVPLAELPAVHTAAAAGALPGKTVIVAPTA
jgi:hypothetical protein